MTFVKGQSGNPRGRKPKAERFDKQIAAAEKRIADRLPKLIDNLFTLADGGYEQITEHYEAAGTITTGQGEAQSLVYPDKDADELVLVKTTQTIAAPDLRANTYLVDRILGKSRERMELTGKDGGPVEVEERGISDDERARRIAAVFDRVRARADRSADSGPPDLATPTGSTD